MCQFDSRSLKVENGPDLLAWKWRTTYCWKDLDKGYNFTFNLNSIEGLHKKLWASKVARVPILGQNDGCNLHGYSQILLQGGKVVASPKSGLWCAPKMLQLHTNQLNIWFV
jgi:hypothetical protein